MIYSHLQFQINQLQKEKISAAIEAILVFVFALFTTIMLPSLLLRYVFGNQALFEPPKALEYIPLTVFTLGIGYFLKTLWENVVRESQIRRLQDELDMMEPYECECGHHHLDWNDQRDLEKLVDETVEGGKKVVKTKASHAGETRSKTRRVAKHKRSTRK